MNRGNISRLHGLVGIGILAAAATIPVGCSSEDFTSCAASRTCKPDKGGSGGDGEAGAGTETGGASGSSSGGRSGSAGMGGSAGTGGSSRPDDGGEGGGATGGTAGEGGAGNDGGAGNEGGTGNEGGAGNNGGSGGTAPPDTTPPTIVSVSPADGAIGVRGDTNLVITFSEPMDRVSAQAAYQSANIPASGVTFSWNAASTVLTVNPNADLAYAESTDTNVVALQFAATITDTAEDRAGNALAADFDWDFRTLRRITQTFTEGSMLRVGSEGNPPGPTCNNLVYTIVGDFDNNAGRFILISRDISSLPAGITEWEAATLSGIQFGASHEDAISALGPVLTYHMSVLPPESASWTTPPLRTLGAFTTVTSMGTRTIDVLPALMDDYQNRSARSQMSQYKISFAQITNGDGVFDQVYVECPTPFSLTARYLIP